MHSVLYITNSIINGRALQNIVKPNMEVKILSQTETVDIKAHDLIIYDWDTNIRRSLADIASLRAMCGYKDIPIILSTNESEANEAKRALTFGANDLIFKPFNAERIINTINGALQPVGVQTRINMEVVNPFLEATVEVIKTMTGTEAIRNDLFLKKNYSLFGDISGVMGISGDTEGVVVLTFPEKLGYYLVAKMVGCPEADLVLEDLKDGVGEFVNMISGLAKTALSKTDYRFSYSVPTVIVGHGHQITHTKNVPVVVLVFDIMEQSFAVQLCVSSTSKSLLRKNQSEKESEKVLTKAE